jgi:hypothetical protein
LPWFRYSGFSGKPAPVIRVYSGNVNSVTVLSSQSTGSLDVLDAEDTPVGSWVSRSAGGFTFVGQAAVAGSSDANRTAGEATLSAGGLKSSAMTETHAALIGVSGESSARFAIDHDGSLHWGDGESNTFHTTIMVVQSASSILPSMTVEPNVARVASIPLPPSNEPSGGGGDTHTMATCETSHASLTEQNSELEISCRVGEKGAAADNSPRSVVVVLRNHGSEPTTLEAGRALVVVRSYLL